MTLLDGYIPTTSTMGSIDWTKVVYPDTTPSYLESNPNLTRTRTEYSQDGRVKAEIDERGNRTEYQYNAVGQLIKTLYADTTANNPNDNPSTTTEYDNAYFSQQSTVISQQLVDAVICYFD